MGSNPTGRMPDIQTCPPVETIVGAAMEKHHQVNDQVRGLKLVGVQVRPGPDSEHVCLRLIYECPPTDSERVFEFSVPTEQEPSPDRAMHSLLRCRFVFIDHSDSQWEGREIEIRPTSDPWPFPIFADSVRELMPRDDKS